MQNSESFAGYTAFDFTDRRYTRDTLSKIIEQDMVPRFRQGICLQALKRAPMR